jgi:hypothetical protein
MTLGLAVDRALLQALRRKGPLTATQLAKLLPTLHAHYAGKVLKAAHIALPLERLLKAGHIKRVGFLYSITARGPVARGTARYGHCRAAGL